MRWPNVTWFHIYSATFWGLFVVMLSELLTARWGHALTSFMQMGMMYFMYPGRAKLEGMK
jgi:hypothetical protein